MNFTTFAIASWMVLSLTIAINTLYSINEVRDLLKFPPEMSVKCEPPDAHWRYQPYAYQGHSHPKR